MMRGDRGRPLADDGMHLLIDPTRTPQTDDVIVMTDAAGMELVRCGTTIGEQMVVACVDRGLRGRLIDIAAASNAPVVIGVLF